jgi:hypothetical protein
MPDVYYARVSNFLSDSRDRFIAQGESADEVLGKMNAYLTSEVAIARYGVLDPEELEQNIRTCIFQKGTKALHNRGPDSRYYHDAPPHD